MSKKYKSSKKLSELKELMEIEHPVEEPEEVVEEPAEEAEEVDDIYESECETMLGKLEELSDEEQKAKALDNLKRMSEICRIMTEKRLAVRKSQLDEEKAELERERLEMEEKSHEAELELRREEVKSIKRNGLIGNIVSIGGTILSFVFYGALIDKQNRFEERGETITSAGGKDLSRHIFDFGKFKKG